MGRKVTRRHRLCSMTLALVLRAPAAFASPSDPVLHERVRPNQTEDAWLLGNSVTPSRASGSSLHGVAVGNAPNSGGSAADTSAFVPDRETETPTVRDYSEPFTPSIAPFKRLVAFDSVTENYALTVRDARLEPIPSAPPSAHSTVQIFHAAFVFGPSREPLFRLPSVGPDAWIESFTFIDERGDIPSRFWRDGAMNWVVEASRSFGVARLELVIGIDPTSLSADFGDPPWTALPKVPPLPARASRAAALVVAQIGLDTNASPRESLEKLVAYFRGFSDGTPPEPINNDIYLDLALARRGVCRHRSFAFVVTAQSVGLSARFIENEAHAWVEVKSDGGWRRIDLGGAGHIARMTEPEIPGPGSHLTPADDPFPWPAGKASSGTTALLSSKRTPAPGSNATAKENLEGATRKFWGDAPSKTSAPPSEVTLDPPAGDVRRGGSIHLHGVAHGPSGACAFAPVEILLSPTGASAHGPGARTPLLLGTLATDASGAFDGDLVIGGTVPRGDYDVKARTPGTGRCGKGASP